MFNFELFCRMFLCPLEERDIFSNGLAYRFEKISPKVEMTEMRCFLESWLLILGSWFYSQSSNLS